MYVVQLVQGLRYGAPRHKQGQGSTLPTDSTFVTAGQRATYGSGPKDPYLECLHWMKVNWACTSLYCSMVHGLQTNSPLVQSVCYAGIIHVQYCFDIPEALRHTTKHEAAQATHR